MFMNAVSSNDTKSPKTDQNWQKKTQKSLPLRILSYVGIYALLIMFIFGVYLLSINGKTVNVVWENDDIEKELRSKIRGKVLLGIALEDYGGFEKTGKLGFDLPTNDAELAAKPGDIMLYQGDQISIFYGENTWSYTKLGHIEMDEIELRALLGDDDIYIRLWLEA